MLPTFNTILRGLSASDAAPKPSVPSNQQIIDGAKAAYGEYQAAVDSMTIALTNTVNNQAMGPALQKLDATNWLSPGVSPSVVAPFWASSDVASFLKTARQTSNLQAAAVGGFVGQLPGIGAPGMIGFARSVSGTPADTGLALSLDIFSSIVDVSATRNLQYSLWVETAEQLHDVITGLFISNSYQGVPIILKLLLTSTLKPYGFAVSSGTSLNLPMSSGVFAGKTSQWKS